MSIKYLLDTHVWLWLLTCPEKLSPATQSVLQDKRGGPFGLAAISPWEVAKKASLGKLKFEIPLRDWLMSSTKLEDINILPMSPEISFESCHLPGNFHRDPADQIIVATARLHRLILITRDQKLLEYEHVDTLW